MAVLNLSLFGPFTAACDEKQPISFPTQKAQALLIYLLVENERPHRRESLFTTLWPGMPEKSARQNLRQVLYSLNKSFQEMTGSNGDDQVSFLLSDRRTIQMNPDAAASVDLHRLGALMREYQNHEHPSLEKCAKCRRKLEEAAEIYQGDFLEDFYLEDSNLFEDWAEAVREKYRRLAIEVLSTLAEIYIFHEEYANAEKVIDRQLEMDDLLENAHRQRMEVLALSGRRLEALRHYQEYRSKLADELGEPPSSAVARLYDRIREEGLSPERSQPHQVMSEARPPRHNLVPQLTPFIGRQRELEQLDELLGNPNNRLISIVGPGGMGKTRLAIACAERQVNLELDEPDRCLFPDGVFFVPLVDIQETDHIPHAIAKAVNRAFNPGNRVEFDRGNVSQQLLDLLAGLRTFLVLDNFELLLEGAGFLVDILQAAPLVKVLATSRERLNLHGEQVFPIDGLDYPKSEALKDRGDDTAKRLFVESAQRIQPGFELGPGDTADLDRICRLLGGMPLGLELAASWVDILPLKAIAAEIQKGIDILETGTRGIPKRHSSLRAVCESTWRQLEENEQQVFASLSVFRNGFTREAAQAVSGASLRVLASLQNKSLIQFQPAYQRYHIHPYLLSYSAEQLLSIPELEICTRDRHAEFFGSLVADQRAAFESGILEAAIHLMEAEIANIRLAWDWALDRDQYHQVEIMMDCICYYYDSRWQIEEAVTICQSGVSNLEKWGRFAENEDRGSPDAVLIKRLNQKICAWYSYFDLYNQLYQAANHQKIPLEVDSRSEKGLIFYYTGAKEHSSGDLDFDEDQLQEVLTLGRETGIQWIVLRLMAFLGDIAWYSGSPRDALNHYQMFLDEAHSQGSHWGEILAYQNMGWAARRMRDYPNAICYFQKSLELAQHHGNTREMIGASVDLGFLWLLLGDLEQACERFTHLVDTSFEAGLSYQGMPIMTHLGIIKWLMGDFEGAEEIIMEAFYLSQGFAPAARIFPSIVAAEVMTLMGRYSEAEVFMEVLKPLVEGSFIGSFSGGRIARVKGWMSLAHGAYPQAENLFNRSMELDRLSSDIEQIAWSLAGLAHALMAQGRWDEARQQLRKALETSLKIRAFIPMIFSLPFALHFLVHEGHLLTNRLCQQIAASPFLGKAKFFGDLIFQKLPEGMASNHINGIDTTPKHREALWEIAREVLGVLSDD
jgi:DNA-binding SARP family transcriptional activator/predicted ATPase